MFNEKEYFFQCPYCFQSISMVLEELYSEQSYIEDCEVCCHPIQISYKTNKTEITEFSAERTDT
jgi:hypothetical protein